MDRVRTAIEAECVSQHGSELVKEMQFDSDFDTIQQKLAPLSEMLSVMRSDGGFPSDSWGDVREALKRIRIEGTQMQPEELWWLLLLLDAVKNYRKYIEERAEHLPVLWSMVSDIQLYPVLAERISAITDHEGHIKDSASPTLLGIRREKERLKATIAHRMQKILKEAQRDGFVDADASVSVRDGRMSIPIAAGNKRRISGIEIDQSASGQTVYIEPAEIVALNNRGVELNHEERREIQLILKSVANEIRPYLDDLQAMELYAATMDMIHAKAMFGIETNGTVPVIENRQGMYWRDARHPLLEAQLKSQGKEIVPLNIEMEAPNQRIVVISGPNAGGKSVCLQTVGLLQFMLQTGIPIPVSEGSKCGIFNDIFVDIGDEQSIDNDLSTYSSHLMHMKHFVRYSSNKTLILIDEFGTGTEPMLGGAIAESVLNKVNKDGAWGVITTHYTNLKHQATQTEGMINGAMLFDTKEIRPLFRLQMGQAGSSFAFEIAKKIGLPDDILNDAKQFVGTEHFDYDKHLREIVRDQHYWEQKRKRIHDTEKRLDETLEKYSSGLENIKKERREIIANAKQEAARMLQEANREIERTIRTIKESQAEREATRKDRAEFDAFKEKQNENSTNTDDAIERKMEKIRQRQQKREEQKRSKQPSSAAQTAEKPPKELPLEVGSIVIIDNDENRFGEVLELNDKEAVVAIGNLRTTIKRNRLKASSKGRSKNAAKAQKISIQIASNIGESVRQKKLEFKPEIDVRGMRADEAIEQVAAFIDEAVICEAPRVNILHGKGNGILRQQIRQFLHTLPYVISAADAHVEMGGAGITVVELA